jgi:hypothetical protein
VFFKDFDGMNVTHMQDLTKKEALRLLSKKSSDKDSRIKYDKSVREEEKT